MTVEWSLTFFSRCAKSRKFAALTVKSMKCIFRHKLDSTYWQAKEAAWQTNWRLPGKKSNITRFIKEQNGVLLNNALKINFYKVEKSSIRRWASLYICLLLEVLKNQYGNEIKTSFNKIKGNVALSSVKHIIIGWFVLTDQY